MDGIQIAFPIREGDWETKMKNISPLALPHFHGLTSEDPDTFMFEFIVVCGTYDYTSDDQKLKLFPSTLKDAALQVHGSAWGQHHRLGTYARDLQQQVKILL